MSGFREKSFGLGANEHRDEAVPKYDFLKVTSATNDFQITIDGQIFDARNGYEFELPPGKSADRIVIDTVASQTIKIIFSLGGRVRGGDVSFTGTVNTSIAVSNSLGTTADTSIAATSGVNVVSSDSTRLAVQITNLGTVTMRWGDSNAGATRGGPISPGSSVSVETTSAVRVYNPHSSAQSVAIVETKLV